MGTEPVLGCRGPAVGAVLRFLDFAPFHASVNDLPGSHFLRCVKPSLLHVGKHLFSIRNFPEPASFTLFFRIASYQFPILFSQLGFITVGVVPDRSVGTLPTIPPEAIFSVFGEWEVPDRF